MMQNPSPSAWAKPGAGWMPLSAFQTTLSESVMPLDVTADAHEGFRARLDQASLDAAIVADISAMPHRATRTAQLIAQSTEPFVKAALMLSGSATLAQGDREARVDSGEVVLYDSDRPYTLSFTQPSRCFVVALPQRELGVPIEALHRLSAIRLTEKSGPARLAIPFLRGLSEDLTLLTGPSGSRMARATSSVISAMVMSELEEAGEMLSRRQDTFESICAYLEEHLDGTELTPPDVADTFHMSVRTLHSTFSARGTSVGAWIRDRRLLRCREALSNPIDNTPIREIASRWGYIAAPAFSRAYRDRFGESPRETRVNARVNTPTR